jgi:hypothetical protein
MGVHHNRPNGYENISIGCNGGNMNTAMNTEAVMNEFNNLVNRYFAVWNETDAERRNALIAQTWTDDASYLDPLMRGDGHAGIDAMVQAVQDRFVGHQFRQLNGVDAHNNHLRFSWELAPVEGPVLVAGTDFAVVAADGRLQTVIGFLDKIPGAGSAQG